MHTVLSLILACMSIRQQCPQFVILVGSGGIAERLLEPDEACAWPAEWSCQLCAPPAAPGHGQHPGLHAARVSRQPCNHTAPSHSGRTIHEINKAYRWLPWLTCLALSPSPGCRVMLPCTCLENLAETLCCSPSHVVLPACTALHLAPLQKRDAAFCTAYCPWHLRLD